MDFDFKSRAMQYAKEYQDEFDACYDFRQMFEYMCVSAYDTLGQARCESMLAEEGLGPCEITENTSYWEFLCILTAAKRNMTLQEYRDDMKDCMWWFDSMSRVITDIPNLEAYRDYADEAIDHRDSVIDRYSKLAADYDDAIHTYEAISGRLMVLLDKAYSALLVCKDLCRERARYFICGLKL